MTPPPGAAPDEVIVGVDVGTTATKVVAFGLGTAWRRTAIREYPLLQPAPGRQVQDPEVVVAAVVAALAEVVAAGAGRRVAGVSVSTAMHGLLALDESMSPLTPVVTWADARSAGEAAALRADGTAALLHRATGTPVHPMTPQTKLMWFARHEPALAARARWPAGSSPNCPRRQRPGYSTWPPASGARWPPVWPVFGSTSCPRSSPRPPS
jgi:gluconokinase